MTFMTFFVNKLVSFGINKSIKYLKATSGLMLQLLQLVTKMLQPQTCINTGCYKCYKKNDVFIIYIYYIIFFYYYYIIFYFSIG